MYKEDIMNKVTAIIALIFIIIMVLLYIVKLIIKGYFGTVTFFNKNRIISTVSWKDFLKMGGQEK